MEIKQNNENKKKKGVSPLSKESGHSLSLSLNYACTRQPIFLGSACRMFMATDPPSQCC